MVILTFLDKFNKRLLKWQLMKDSFYDMIIIEENIWLNFTIHSIKWMPSVVTLYYNIIPYTNLNLLCVYKLKEALI